MEAEEKESETASDRSSASSFSLNTDVEALIAAYVQNKEIIGADHPRNVEIKTSVKERHLLRINELDNFLNRQREDIKDQQNINQGVLKSVAPLQQESLKLKENVVRFSEEHENNLKEQENDEKQLENTQKSFRIKQESHSQKTKEEKIEQQKVENTALQAVHLKELQMQSYDKSSTMNAAKLKTKAQHEEMELNKLRQDYLLANLESTKIRLRDKISFCKAQTLIRTTEAKNLEEVVLTAEGDLESMKYDMHVLMQYWTGSIMTLEKEDKNFTKVRKTVEASEDEVRGLNADISNTKKLTRQVQDDNEKLTMQYQLRKSAVLHEEKSIDACNDRQFKLENEINFYERLVEQTEAELEKLEKIAAQYKKNLETCSKKIEKLSELHRNLEADYVKLLHEKLTTVKACDVTEKLRENRNKEIEELENKYVLKEGEKAKVNMKLSDIHYDIQCIEEELDNLKKIYEEKEKTVLQSESDIQKSHTVIERRQTDLADLNKKLVALVSSAGGEELGPMEREIANYKKEIAITLTSKQFLEQEWIKLQKQLIKRTNETSVTFQMIENLRKTVVVFEEKKIRIDADISKEEKEIKDLERNIERFQKELGRLMSYLHKEIISEDRLKQEADMMKGELFWQLCDAKVSLIKMEKCLEAKKRERHQFLKELSEHRILCICWSDRLKLFEENRMIIQSEAHVEEMEMLNYETRRKKARGEQIKKEEDFLLKQVIDQNVRIFVRDDVLNPKKTKTTYEYLTQRIEKLKENIRTVKLNSQDAKQQCTILEENITELKIEDDQVVSSILTKREALKNIDYDTKNKQRENCQLIIKLSIDNLRYKLLNDIKGNRYVRCLRNNDRYLMEIEKCQEKLVCLREVIENIIRYNIDLKQNLLNIVEYTVVGLELD